MQKLKVVVAVLTMAVFATLGCLAFVVALRNIFGKSVELKPALFAALILWIGVGGSILWDYLKSKKNPRS